MKSGDGLPDYQPRLAAYHAAFAVELRAMVDSLPIEPGRSVLDVACGDGTYLPMLADRVGSKGRVVGLDLLPAYLKLARETAKQSRRADRVEFVAAPLERLPFEDDPFDFVWCAQSFYSLPEPVEALRRMTRVVKPGGTVAVLENDSLHHVLLPWPIEVEMAIRRAELLDHALDSKRPRKFYVGRQLRQVFREAGLVEIRGKTWAADRHAPLGDHERFYLKAYLDDLRERIAPHLESATLALVDELLGDDPEKGLLHSIDLTATFLDRVVWGRKSS